MFFPINRVNYCSVRGTLLLHQRWPVSVLSCEKKNANVNFRLVRVYALQPHDWRTADTTAYLRTLAIS